MASSDVVPIESVSSQGVGVRAVFEWLGDRYGHQIYLVIGNNGHAAWQSRSMLPGQPVFQELHQQQTDGEPPVLFLSGAGAGVHWSMSVETTASGKLTFDVAARVARRPVPEAIGYERLPGGERIRLEADLPETVVQQKDLGLTVLHSEAAGISVPATMRWKYTIDVTEGISPPS